MPSHPAITISRSLGSGGTEAGFQVARQLGWNFCDRRILRLAADAAGLSVADLAGQENRAVGFGDWLMTVLSLGSPEAPYSPLPELPIYSRELFEVQKGVMARLVDHAPSVIVGRGGFVALQGRPGTLHVSIHASLPARVESLLRRGKAPDREAALAAIAASDRGRAAFLRAVAGVDWRDPGLFDLVLDTTEGGAPAAAARIIALAGERFHPMG